MARAKAEEWEVECRRWKAVATAYRTELIRLLPVVCDEDYLDIEDLLDRCMGRRRWKS